MAIRLIRIITVLSFYAAIIIGIAFLLRPLEMSPQQLSAGIQDGTIKSVKESKGFLVGARNPDRFWGKRRFSVTVKPSEKATLTEDAKKAGIWDESRGLSWGKIAAITCLFLAIIMAWRLPSYIVESPKASDENNPRPLPFELSLVSGLVMLLALWAIHLIIPMAKEEVSGFYSLSALRHKLFDSGWIPLAIMGTACAGMHYLDRIRRALLDQLKKDYKVEKEFFDSLLSAPDLRQHHARLKRYGPKGHYSERYLKLLSRYEKDGDLNAVITLKNDILEMDEERFTIFFSGVHWCEAALPLLGFIGTVIGIGGAMVDVSKAVNILVLGTGNTDVMGWMNRGFEGMALAFDTTFFGLMGVLIVGPYHAIIRNSLAKHIAEVRRILSEAVGRWEAKGQDGVVLVLKDEVSALKEAVEESERRALLYRESLKLTVEHVIRKDPKFRSIRDVLFAPVVEFMSVGEDLLSELRQKLGNSGAYLAIGVHRRDIHGGVLAVSRGGRNDLLRFDVNNPRSVTIQRTSEKIWQILPINVDLAAAVSTRFESGNIDSGDTRSLKILRMDNGTAVVEKEWWEFGNKDTMMPLVVGKRSGAIVLRYLSEDEKHELWMLFGKDPERLGHLPHTYLWQLFSLHADSGTLFMLGIPAAGRGATLLRAARILPGKGSGKDAAKPEPPEESDTGGSVESVSLELLDHQIAIAEGKAVDQLVSLTSHTGLLLMSDGDLMYWDITQGEPRQLKHANWKGMQGCKIIAGSLGWIAVAKGETLSMWQVQKGGWLDCYDSGEGPLSIQGVRADTLHPSFDGKFLFGISEQALFTWKFPQLAIDHI